MSDADEFSDDNMLRVDSQSVESDIFELRSKFSYARTDVEEQFLYLLDKIKVIEIALQEKE